jgi:exodeoxyribonuclease V beta subunit
VVDDSELFGRLLKEQMRSVWPKVYGPLLFELLEISGFSTATDRFLEKLTRIARFAYRPAAGDLLLPAAGTATYAEIRVRMMSLLRQLKHWVGPAATFSPGFSKLNIHGATKKAILQNIVLPLERYFQDPGFSQEDIPAAAHLLRDIGAVKSGPRKGAECLIPDKWSKAGANLQVCPNLAAITAALVELDRLLGTARHLVAIQSIHRLQADVARFKRRKGWISYDDMLTQLDTALHSEGASGLLTRLRASYRMAFVDEFQDTDPIQWRIFRRIFLDDFGTLHRNPLILIGDPKQAIYAFRGADVFTYLQARMQIKGLAQENRANLYRLTTNWRSLPQLLGPFNALFAQPAWFCKIEAAAGFDIGYEDAVSPAPGDLPLGLAADASAREALNLVDLRGCRTAKMAQARLAGFIAAEIRYLVATAGIVLQPKNEPRRRLDYGDICILVRSRGDMALLEPELAARQIPYSFYKKPGLFQSEAAEALSLMFHAILDPGDAVAVKKALLTPFFQATLQDIYHYDALPPSHPVHQLLLGWQHLAHQRQWGALFQSLAEDSGLIFRQSDQADWDRMATHFSQIFEHLQVTAYRLNLDFRALSAFLDVNRNQSAAADEDANIHQIETEARKVQIMTMHVSKGLQFPVVFIAGGLTRPFVENYHVCHRLDSRQPGPAMQKIIDLTGSAFKQEHEKEKADEEKRLFYVALTRAQIKLYLPHYPIQGSAAWVGPLAGFVAAAIQAAFPSTAPPDGVRYLSAPMSKRPAEMEAADPTALSGLDVKDQKIIFNLPEYHDFRNRMIRLESFSSLHSDRSTDGFGDRQGPGFLTAAGPAKDADEPWSSDADVESSAAGADSADQLPGGTEIGSMFHAILEQIDFGQVRRHPDQLLTLPDTRHVIDRCLAHYGISEKWRPLVGRVISTTLTTPLALQDASLTLGDLKPEQRIHETEFYFPCDLPAGMGHLPSEVQHQPGSPGFIRGYIDMIFQFRGKYYIADWKSNRLEDGYDQAALGRSMDQAGYRLQYRLYTLALMRWMRQFLKDNEIIQKSFGGVVYLYLRGMGAGAGHGIYFVPPEEVGSMAALERQLMDRLAMKGGEGRNGG